jgi:hypothetical protein
VVRRYVELVGFEERDAGESWLRPIADALARALQPCVALVVERVTVRSPTLLASSVSGT